MGLTDIRKRLAMLERSVEIVRLCVALPTPEGCDFYGFRVTHAYGAENLKPDEYFDVHGTDRAECAARAHLLASERWTDIPLLVIAMHPITEPQPRGNTR